jgi:co-chaperonin GroES (HSP10)
VNLRPLGDRILIKPERQADTTDSGLVLMEQPKPEQTGTVVAVGLCPHPLKHEAETMADELLERYAGLDLGEEWTAQLPELRAATLLRQVVAREPLVKVGDYVVFSWVAGQEIYVEDGEERYLLMREADILCVVEGVETA